MRTYSKEVRGGGGDYFKSFHQMGAINQGAAII